MNTQSNATPAVEPLYWSLRRELWESRSIYIAPLIAAGLALAGFLISVIRLPEMIDPYQHRVAETQYAFAAGLLMLTALLVGIFYSLDALHGERRDRSILFWKSLPVSDLDTVAAKAIVPIVILPLLAFALMAATQFIMLGVSTVVLQARGQSVAMLWKQLDLPQMLLMLLYHMVTVHALWHAPIYGWLLLVSAWARRGAFLWAFLPPLAIGFVEKIAFNTSHFAALLLSRFTGGSEAMMPETPGRFPIGPMMHPTPLRFFATPGLWVGLGVTVLFLLAAARIRRYRDPI